MLAPSAPTLANRSAPDIGSKLRRDSMWLKDGTNYRPELYRVEASDRGYRMETCPASDDPEPWNV